MIEWWGPILHEYYAGTELNGFCYVKSDEWLERPGTVGKPLIGIIHICDDEGNELPIGESGTIYFEREVPAFEYHNDPAKTAESRHDRHELWSTLGDVGRVDDDGYLYLTDRKAFMIISGGVNIYPQEIEDRLVMHPKVGDVAVFGVPNEDFGEEVKAVVEPVAGIEADDALATELLAYAREHLANYKVPRSIDFRDDIASPSHRQALQAHPARRVLERPQFKHRVTELAPGDGRQRERSATNSAIWSATARAWPIRK